MELPRDDVLEVKLKFARVQDHLVQDLKRWLACHILLVLGNKNVLVESENAELLKTDENSAIENITGPLLPIDREGFYLRFIKYKFMLRRGEMILQTPKKAHGVCFERNNHRYWCRIHFHQIQINYTYHGVVEDQTGSGTLSGRLSNVDIQFVHLPLLRSITLASLFKVQDQKWEIWNLRLPVLVHIFTDENITEYILNQMLNSLSKSADFVRIIEQKKLCECSKIVDKKIEDEKKENIREYQNIQNNTASGLNLKDVMDRILSKLNETQRIIELHTSAMAKMYRLIQEQEKPATTKITPSVGFGDSHQNIDNDRDYDEQF